MRKHWLKRTIAYVLTLCMMASLLVGLPPMEVKAATSGDLGNGITWSVNGDTLTITGNGAIPDYQPYMMPWKDCSAQIKNVIIGEGITRIGNDSFYTNTNVDNTPQFTNLQSIKLPQSLTSIGKCAFWECTGITKVSFPENLTSIDDSAFSYCTGITEVTLPENLTSMGYGAFQGCTSIQTVIFPKKLTSISERAFQNCKGIKTVTFPEELTSIGERAFYNCTSIETVALPNSLTRIGERAFGECRSLRVVICKPTTPPTLDNNALFAFYPAYFYTNELKGIKVPKGDNDAIYNQYCSQWSNWKDFIEGVNFHTHNWVYAASGNVISAYCNSEEGKEDCTANGVTNAKTLTLSAPSDLTYNGQPKTAHATDDLSVLTGTSLGKINYEGVSPTVYEKSETAPTNVGTYKATLTLTVDENTSYTAEQEFEIEKADATATVAAKNGLTYNGKDQELVTSTINGCTGYYRIGETGAWSTTVPKAKGAGTYEIYYYGKADSNHNSVGSEESPKGPVSVTIAKKALNAEMITINPASKVFNDAPTTPEVTVSDMVDSTQCITADDYEISGADTQEEVGDYTITVTAKETGNYSGSAQKIWRITGATFGDNDITVTPYEDVYDGEAHGINIALSGDAEGAEITYCETESGTYTTTKPTYKDVKTTDGGTYTVYYKVNRRGYYEKKGSSTVKINPKEVGIEWTHTGDLVYNAAEQKPTATATGLIAGDTCNVTVTGGQTNSNKKAGSTPYTATADSLDNANYKLPETKPTTAFTIAPLEIGIAWGNASFTYNGREQKPAATATGLVEGDSCILTVGGEQKNVGEYKAIVTALSDGNYQLPSEVTKDFSISPKALTDSTVTVSVTGGDNGENTSSFIWDGSYKKPTITVTDNETGENVTLTEDTDYIVKGKTEEVDVNPAGSPYKITLTGTGNYTGKRAVTWTIVKKSITPVVTIEGWTYGETPKAPALTGMTLMGDVTYTYYTDEACKTTTTADNGAEEAGGVPTFAGTYYVKAVVAETDNYDETESAAASFTIAKKAVTVTPKADQKKTYGDRDPVFTYDVQLLEGDTLSGKLSRAEGEDAGTYKIKKGTLENANYDITVDETVDFTIEPKKLTADMISMSPLSYPYDGSKKTATYAYHDDTVEVDDTGVTASDVTYKGDLTGTLCGQYTVKIVGQRNYTGTISKSWFISPVTDVTVDYDGKAHRIECATNLTGVSVKFYNEETKAYDIALEEFESLPSYTMPGVYEYKYRMVVDEGTDFEETADGTALLTINKSTMESVTVSIASSIGYGKPVAPSVLSKGEPITGVEVTYYYKKKSEEDSAYTTTVPTDKGDYTVKAVISESEYWAGATATANFSIGTGTLGDHNPKVAYYGAKDSGVKTVSLWSGFNALDGVSYEVSSFDNNGIISEASVSPKGVVSYTLTGTSENNTRATIYILVHSTNYEDKTVEVTVEVDAAPPTGSIAIYDTTILWTNFLESSSFGTFLKKNNQAVTITGSDVGGKPVDIQYFVSDKRMTLDAVKEMADTEWTALSQNETISLSAGKNVIYAKLKDHVGNTTYLSSDGIVIYEDAAGVTTELSYVSKSGKTAEAKVDLKGNTVKAIALVNGETATALTENTDYTVSENGTITFTNTYLETLAVSATPYKFKVSYHPAGVEYVTAEGNEAPAETELSLTVSKDTGTTSGGGNGTPSTPSGGNGTPSTPGGGDSKPSTPAEDYTIPVKSESTVEVKAEIKEGTADVSEITAETINKVTDAKGESKVDTIKIDLSGAKQEVTGVTISKKSVETLAKATNDNTNGIDTVTIELSKATVVLDTKTLETLAEDAKGTNIRLVVDDKEHKELNTSQQTAVKEYHVATSFEAYFESDGTRIHDFKGGKATVSIDFTPEAGKSIEHYHMVYLPDEGGMTRFKTKYENGQLIFTTTHFSDYAVIYDENEKNETGNEEEKPAEEKPAEEEKPVDNKPAKAQIAANTIAINKGLKVSQTGTKINVSWGKVADADGYLVYAAYCGTDFGKAVKTVKDPSSVSTAITKINGKKLDLKRNFKVYVKAYKLVDGKKVTFGKSISAHIAGSKNPKYTNVKELKLTSKSKLALAVGKTSKIKAKVVLVDSAKKQLSDSHTKEFSYASSNKKVAAVGKNGKITAKAKGTCYIYVYARNGYAKKVTVTVK